MAYIAVFSGVNDDSVQLMQAIGTSFMGSLLKVQKESILSQSYSYEPDWIDTNQQEAYSIVNLPTGGAIKGAKGEAATTFHNIKYAKAPVGNLRYSCCYQRISKPKTI